MERGIDFRCLEFGLAVPISVEMGTFHATDATTRPKAHATGATREHAMTKSVLIVEDNELNMKLFNDLLQARGYATLQSEDGVEAIELARTHTPDLILMDIQLPKVSGMEIIRRLKADKALKHIPVVAVTAFAMAGDEARIREVGCDGYIAKPISVPSFLEVVAEFLE